MCWVYSGPLAWLFSDVATHWDSGGEKKGGDSESRGYWIGLNMAKPGNVGDTR